VSPPPTFPGGGTGNPGGSTGTGPSSPFSPSTGSGPTATSGATGPAGLTSAGLIALSVAPVGSLQGNAAVSATASTQVAFSLPSQSPSAPSLGDVLVRFITTTQVLGHDEPANPNGPPAQVPGGEAGGPAVVFDEALKRVSESSGALPANVATVAAPVPTSEDLPPAMERQDPKAHDEAIVAAETALPEATSEEAAEETGVEVRLSDLAWGAVGATIASISLVVTKRYRSARYGPTVSLGREQAAKGGSGSEEALPGLAGPMGDRNRRSRRVEGLPWQRTITARRGLCS